MPPQTISPKGMISRTLKLCVNSAPQSLGDKILSDLVFEPF